MAGRHPAPDGAWHNYYWPDGSVEEAKLDTNVCAYIATGVWHHWRCTWDRAFVDHLWPTVERALDWVLSLRRADGLVLWAVEADGTRPWDYALLTGSSSIQHALRCAAALADVVGEPRPEWAAAADVIAAAIVDRPDAFEPKDRWAMDWYYPVLTGALPGEAAKGRLAEGWDTFAMEGLGIRCVSDEPWVTASETAECALAFAAIGDRDTATDLLRWTRAHRRDDGAVLDRARVRRRRAPARFPFEEHTSYTAAAVILAADAIAGASPAAVAVHPAPDGRRRLIEEGAMGEGGDERVDVLVIGAGISGIGAAYHLQTYCPGRTYAILEGRERPRRHVGPVPLPGRALRQRHAHARLPLQAVEGRQGDRRRPVDPGLPPARPSTSTASARTSASATSPAGRRGRAPTPMDRRGRPRRRRPARSAAASCSCAPATTATAAATRPSSRASSGSRAASSTRRRGRTTSSSPASASSSSAPAPPR